LVKVKIVNVVFFILVVVGSTAYAGETNGCPSAKFSAPTIVSNQNTSAILITHPSAEYDFSRSAKAGIDRLISFGKVSGFSSVYLQNSSIDEVYVSDCDPDFWVSSQAGEFNFSLAAETVFFGGGYWELCQDSTFSDVIRSWATTKPKLVRLVQVMDAIYVSGTSVYVWDEFYARYAALLASKPIVNFPNSPTVTLLELMSVMRDDAQRIEVISRNLPNFGYLPADFGIQLFFNGKFVRELRTGNTPLNPKLLKIEFVETTP
jgi:hypothetical protein